MQDECSEKNREDHMNIGDCKAFTLILDIYANKPMAAIMDMQIS